MKGSHCHPARAMAAPPAEMPAQSSGETDPEPLEARTPNSCALCRTAAAHGAIVGAIGGLIGGICYG